MRKKGLLKRGIAALVVGTVTASALAGALSASNSINPDEI